MIAVLGASEASSEQQGIAYEVGRLLAKAGVVLVCGGGKGVMEAACRGAWEAGGTTVGLLPGLDSREHNGWVTIPIATGLGELRNGLIVRACEAAIAIGGGAGTLSEIGLAAKAGKKVFGLSTFEILTQGEEAGLVTPCGTAQEAVAKALESQP